MDKSKLKLIVRNLELLVDSLKTEIYSDSTVSQYQEPKLTDYDEIFYDGDDDEYKD